MKKNTKRNKKNTKPVAVLDLTNLTSIDDFNARIEAFTEAHGISVMLPELYIPATKKESWLSRMWKNIKNFFKTILFLN